MDMENLGPLAFFLGKWESQESSGENRAPDSNRGVENTRFRQEILFESIEDVENHEQALFGLRYSTLAWEEEDEDSFHEEVGYWLWDPKANEVMKCFSIPRGMSVIAGGQVHADDKEFILKAELGSSTYGILSNKFLDEEFQTVHYQTKITKIDDDTFSYDENSQLKIKGQEKLFDHTEKNTLKRVR